MIRMLLLFCVVVIQLSGDVSIATWNVKDCFYPSDIETRKLDFRKFYRENPADLIVLQEICSEQDVEMIAKHMGISSPKIAISDFGKDPTGSPDPRGSFEIGIISNYKFGSVSEIDLIADQRGNELQDNQLDLTVSGLNKRRSARGVLIVEIPQLKLTLYGLHLKSSSGRVGKTDSENAEKREYLSAVLLEEIAKRESDRPEWNHVVLGDFNVGHSDKKKNGTNLKEDVFKPLTSGKDGYDDTHYLFQSGVISGMKMVNLAQHINAGTYPTYPGTPIDNIYVLESEIDNYTPAYKASRTYNSDHLALFTTYKSP